MKEKVIQITFCTLFILIVFIIGFITIINDEEISVKEGRALERFPDVTYEGIINTTYFNSLTNAFADQLAFREKLIKIYYLANFQRYTGDVVKGKENELFLFPQIIQNETKYLSDLENVTKNNINKVAKEVVKAKSKFIFLSIPRKDVLMEEYLPDTYIKGTELYLKSIAKVRENVTEDVEIIDSYEILKGNVKAPFYKTDHHMNIRGAYPLFEYLISRINKDGYNIEIGKLEDEYDIYKQVANGSFNRKIGQSVRAGKEELNLIYKGKKVTFKRYENGELSYFPIFGMENTYASAYMGGDMAETVIDTNNDKAPNILFVGSSYTNILEALAVQKFNKVVAIDYRHNTTGKSVADYVKEHDIDYTVFICAQSTEALNISSIKQYLGIK